MFLSGYGLSAKIAVLGQVEIAIVGAVSASGRRIKKEFFCIDCITFAGYSVNRNIDTELVYRALGNALYAEKMRRRSFTIAAEAYLAANRYQTMLTQNKIKGGA